MLVMYQRSGNWKKNRGCLNVLQFMVAGIRGGALQVSYCILTSSLRVKSIHADCLKSWLNHPKHLRNKRNHQSML